MMLSVESWWRQLLKPKDRRSIAHYAWVEFRPRPTHFTEEAIRLGLVLEFATAEFWVIARSLFPDPQLDGLDGLSKEILERRESVIDAEIRKVLEKASRPGDIIRLLAASNPWAFHVTEPAIVEMDSKAATTEATAESALWNILNKEMSAETEARKFGHSSRTRDRVLNRPDAPRPWMPPRHILHKPLLHHVE